MVIDVQKRIGQVVMYIIRRKINSARSSYTPYLYPPVLVRLHACTSHSQHGDHVLCCRSHNEHGTSPDNQTTTPVANP